MSLPFASLSLSPTDLIPRAVGAADDLALWAKLDAALGEYVAEDLRHSDVGFPEQGSLPDRAWARLLHARIDAAASALARTVPPPERRAIRLITLPLYAAISASIGTLITARERGDLGDALQEQAVVAALMDRIASLNTALTVSAAARDPGRHLAAVPPLTDACPAADTQPASDQTELGPVQLLRLSGSDLAATLPGLALYGRTDLADSKALALYDQARIARLAELTARQNDIQPRLAIAIERLRTLEVDMKRQHLATVLDDLRTDATAADEEVRDGLIGLGGAMSQRLEGIEEVVKQALLLGYDIRGAIAILRRSGAQDHLSPDERRIVAQALGTIAAGVLETWAGATHRLSEPTMRLLEKLHVGIAVATLGAALTWDYHVRAAVDTLQQPVADAAERHRLLSGRVAMLQARWDANAREIRALAADCSVLNSWRLALGIAPAGVDAAVRPSADLQLRIPSPPAEVQAGAVVGIELSAFVSGGIPPYTFSLDPKADPLPAGLELNAGGRISGTTTGSGTRPRVCVTDAGNRSACATVDLSVKPAPVAILPRIPNSGPSPTQQPEASAPAGLTFNPLDPPTVVVGDPYPPFSFCRPAPRSVGILCDSLGLGQAPVNPTGGQEPYTFSIGRGFLPFGIALNLNGILSGSPLSAGTFPFDICVKDSAGTVVCRSVTLVVSNAPDVGAPPGGTQPAASSVAGSWSGTATTVNAFCTYSGSMSLTVAESGGVISGTVSFGLALVRGNQGCAPRQAGSANYQGSSSGSSLSFTVSGLSLTGSVSGNQMTGTTVVVSGGTVTSGKFTLSK